MSIRTRRVTALAISAAITATSAVAWAEYNAANPDRNVPPAASEGYPADNSGRNARDAGGATVTPEDQSNDKADLAITQAVRKAVTADDSLSVNGQNVKIVTTGGVVTLRGPVKDDAEKSNIGNKAKSITGVSRVDNQLEVTAQ